MAYSESSTVGRPSAESVGHDDEEELDSSVWSELPDNLVENLFSWLPDLPCLTRFRRVSKSWNSLFSSAYFINLWNEAHRDKNRCEPWLLLLSSPKAAIPALVYSFPTNTWRAMRFSFLPEFSKYGHVNFKGSAGSLLLMDVMPSSSMSAFNVSMLCICNPLTESWISLPPLVSITRVMASCITDTGNGNYSVMVMGKNIRNLFVLEVYESSLKAWKFVITESMPDGFSIRNEEMVFCDGFVLCITVKVSGILIYSMHSRSWTMAAMPPLLNFNCNLRSTRLLSCESKIFMVGGLEKHANSTLNEIIIWQFEILDSVRSEWKWKEIGRMPQTVFEDFVRTSCSNWFECVAVGKYMCFRAHRSLEVVAYNIRDCTWIWLPKYDGQHNSDHKHMLLRSMAYQPWLLRSMA